MFEITRAFFFQTVKGQNIFWNKNAFSTCSWRFLISNKLGQLEFKLKIVIGIQKHARKVKKGDYFLLHKSENTA